MPALSKIDKIGRVLDLGTLTRNQDIADVCGCHVRLVSIVRARRREAQPGASLREQVERLGQDVRDLRRAFLRFSQDRRSSRARRPRVEAIRAAS